MAEVKPTVRAVECANIAEVNLHLMEKDRDGYILVGQPFAWNGHIVLTFKLDQTEDMMANLMNKFAKPQGAR